jgi:hypothetical protein
VGIAILLAALFPACGGASDDTNRVATEQTAPTGDPAARDAILELSTRYADSPIFSISDYMPPVNVDMWVRDATGLVRGELLAIERGGIGERRLGNEEYSVTIPEVSVDLQVRVSEARGAATSAAIAGEVVEVQLPFWTGAFPPGGIDHFFGPLLSAPIPPGTQVLAAVEPATDGAVRPSHIVGPIIGAPDGNTATLLGFPSLDGAVWGMTSLDEITAVADAAVAARAA